MVSNGRYWNMSFILRVNSASPIIFIINIVMRNINPEDYEVLNKYKSYNRPIKVSVPNFSL
jgi:hypothetical protein